MRARSFFVHRGAFVVAILSVAGAVGLLTPSCGNPVQDAKIEALGPEVAGVPAGQFHRPGQPCLVCHSKYGGKQPEMVIGGTVFTDLSTLKPVQSVEVVLTDAVGDSRTTGTNCVGNFWIPSASWSPRFPLAAEIRYRTVYKSDGTPDEMSPKKVKAMGSVISRDGSCASCHQLSSRARSPKTDASGTVIDYNSAGWIYCNTPDDTTTFPDPSVGCGGKPPPPPSGSTSSATTGSGG